MKNPITKYWSWVRSLAPGQGFIIILCLLALLSIWLIFLVTPMP
jgi:hypothetical protein